MQPLNGFHTLVWCFHGCLWTTKYRLSRRKSLWLLVFAWFFLYQQKRFLICFSSERILSFQYWEWISFVNTMCVCVCVFVPIHCRRFFHLQWCLGDTWVYRSTILYCRHYTVCFCQVPSSQFLNLSYFTSKDKTLILLVRT